MTATEPAAPPAPTAAPAETFTVTRADWQRLLDRVAEQTAAIRHVEEQLAVVRVRPEPIYDRSAGRVVEIEPHRHEAAAAYEAELDDLLAHLAAHPADRWVAYRGRQRVRFGPTGHALYQDLIREYPDGQFALFGIDEVDKYPDSTVA
ncbi:MAG: hypothetical protein K2X82_12670 [Gemmataceae bacterium]|nr:hypothetical protein [Gemmataceae bacterium]